MRAEANETDTKKLIEKINKTESNHKMNKTGELLTMLHEKKR